MGISLKWATSFLGMRPDDDVVIRVRNSRDREFLANAAVKAFKEKLKSRGTYMTGEDHWWLDRAKKELLRGER